MLAVLGVFILAAPIDVALAKFAEKFDVDLIFRSELNVYRTKTVRCDDCRPEEFLRLMLPPELKIRMTESKRGKPVFSVIGKIYCIPEMGADAPLPPCRPRPPHIQVVRTSGRLSIYDTNSDLD